MSEDRQELPHGWVWTTIGEVTYPSVEQRAPDAEAEFKYLEISSIDNRSKRIVGASVLRGDQAPTRARQRLRAGDVLVSMTRPNLNAVALVPPHLNEAVGSTGFDVLRPVVVPSEWLFYAVQEPSFVTEMTRRVLGVVYPAVRPKDIRSFRLPLPPLGEQQRIVREIEKQVSRLNAAEALLERVRFKLAGYRASVLKAACEGRLVPTEVELARAEGRGYSTKNKPIKEFRRPDLQALPEGWTWVIVDDLAKKHQGSICAGPFGTIFKARDFRPEGVPIIFLRHVKPGSYITDKPTFMEADKWKTLFEPYSVSGGELLVTKLGDPPGAAAIYPCGRGPAMLTPDVIKMEVDNNLTLTKFMMYYFNSPVAQRFAFGAAFGTTRPRLTLPIFRSIPVPLPPLDEQSRIVAEIDRRLSILEMLNVEVSSGLARVKTVEATILRKAFEGRLIQECPDGEPASTLLERIRQSRATREQVNTRPRRGQGIKPGASAPGSDAKTNPKPRRGGGGVRGSASAPSGLPDELEPSSLRLKPQALRLGPFGAEDSVAKHPLGSQDGERNPTNNDEQDFLVLSRDEQIDLVWDALFGLGPVEKDEAIRTVAFYLRDEGKARFQRLRAGGPLYETIAATIDRGVREGSFDRPRRGHVRALFPDARDYNRDDWHYCLLKSLNHEAVPEADALRTAAEWARENMGLEFIRLRKNGVILKGLKAALRRAIRAGEVRKNRGMVLRSSALLTPAEARP